MKRKIAAILAADVVGYSRLVAEDEEEALRRLASYRAVFDDFVGRSGGRIFNTAGDAVLAEFQSAVDAVRCAVDLQETLRARNTAYPPSRHMNFRIGITIGDVVEREGDLLGDGVNIAARLELMAPAGGICLSRSVYEAVANKLSAKFTDLGRQQLKNIPDPVHAYTIAFESQSSNGKSSASRPIPRWQWGLLVAVLVAGAGAAGFLVPRIDSSDRTTTAADAKPGSKPIAAPAPPADGGHARHEETAPEPEPQPRPPPEQENANRAQTNADRAASQAVMNRYWSGCVDGTEADAIVQACEALIAYNVTSGSQLAMVHLKLGRAQRQNEKVDDAIQSYTEAIRLSPSAEVYNDRGIAYFDKQSWELAIDDYTEAIKLDPKFGEALNNRAWTLLKVGRTNAALMDANKAVELLPDKAYAWDTRGHIAEALNNRTQAISDYRKALQLDPQSDGAREALKTLGAQP